MKEVLSPLTGVPCEMLSEIPSSEIIALYKKDFSLDVSSFFLNVPYVSIFRCPDSEYAFYYPFHVAGDAQFYASLERLGDYYPDWKWENESALKEIQDGDHVLDVGCGNGAFLNRLSSRKKVICTGIDTNSQAIANANERQRGSFFVSDIAGWQKEHAEQYDVITCFQILEHITDPLDFLKKLIPCLKKNGVLIIAVPNNTPFLYKHDRMHTLNLPPHHSGLWNKRSLEYLQKILPLQTLEVKTQPIGDQLNYYEMIQLENLKKKHNVLFGPLIGKLSISIYGKLLRARKEKIDGHSILISFRKVNLEK